MEKAGTPPKADFTAIDGKIEDYAEELEKENGEAD